MTNQMTNKKMGRKGVGNMDGYMSCNSTVNKNACHLGHCKRNAACCTRGVTCVVNAGAAVGCTRSRKVSSDWFEFELHFNVTTGQRYHLPPTACAPPWSPQNLAPLGCRRASTCRPEWAVGAGLSGDKTGCSSTHRCT